MSILSALGSTLPCRSLQIGQLYNLFGHKEEPFPGSVYISGGPSVGKSIVVKRVFEEVGVRFAVINMIECYTPRILFETILRKLCGLTEVRCENMMDFIQQLRGNRTKIEGSVIIIDKADKLRTMDFNIFPGLLKLKELTGGIPLSVIFLSQIILQKFYSKTNIVETIQIVFPQYNKEELLEILTLDFDYARSLIVNNTNDVFQFDLDFYRNYLNVFLSVFYRNCRDLTELRYIARRNFLNYCQPIINKENTIKDSMALWRKVAPTFKQALQNLYQRVSSETPTQNLELPFYAKYLLIAAYLASYNPAKDDKRLFVKYHGKKTKTLSDVKKKSKVSEQLNTLLGPKPFTFDRLLAIFYSIVEDQIGFNNNLLVQVSSLVELQLLSSLSDSSSLDGVKYKCNVNFDFIQTICKMVGFNIRKYLSDFSHL